MNRAIFALGALLPTIAPAQAAPTVTLRPLAARLAVEFSDLTTMRELGDGRVLLFDRKEQRLVVADFSTDAVRDVSRTGHGPGEFDGNIELFAAGGDSTLATAIGRWLVFDGDSVVATLPSDHPAVHAMWLYPLGADARGRVIAHRGRKVRNDTLDLILVERSGGRSEKVAALRVSVPTRGTGGARGIEGGGFSIGRAPYDVRFEQPFLFTDGTIAVARYEPYRVDWRAPDGHWTRGAPLPVRPVRLDDRERAAYIRLRPSAAGATVWPVHVPPFNMTRMLGTPEGWLAIPRVPTADHPDPRYDMVDRRGSLRAQLLLPANQRLLGFGAASAYVITTDDDGIQRLSRHPWPPTASPRR